mmetsp:Transcript_26824/g.40036  ORF Transcript_26824/g.40036 Transcript_26824/m.40036 type:complete len:224 (+) Transcript_26824:1-672(+)
MTSISMACHISKALAEIHDDGGVVLNNLSVDHIIVNEKQNNEKSRKYDSCISIHMISLGSASCSASFSGDEKHEEMPVQNDLRSLGDVFFHLFSGQCPFKLSTEYNGDNKNQGKSISECDSESFNVSTDGAEYQDSIHISCNIQTDGEIPSHRYRPLKELRSILTKSLVPPYLSLFILELMEAYGSVETTRQTCFNTAVASALPYYKSAREVSNHLYSIETAA